MNYLRADEPLIVSATGAETAALTAAVVMTAVV